MLSKRYALNYSVSLSSRCLFVPGILQYIFFTTAELQFVLLVLRRKQILTPHNDEETRSHLDIPLPKCLVLGISIWY